MVHDTSLIHDPNVTFEFQYTKMISKFGANNNVWLNAKLLLLRCKMVIWHGISFWTDSNGVCCTFTVIHEACVFYSLGPPGLMPFNVMLIITEQTVILEPFLCRLTKLYFVLSPDIGQFSPCSFLWKIWLLTCLKCTKHCSFVWVKVEDVG